MPKFFVTAVKKVDVTVEVEAESRDEAEELAYEHLPGSLCHQCTDEVNDGDWNVEFVATEEERDAEFA